MSNEEKPVKKTDQGNQLTLGLSMGTALGMILGAVFDNFGLWLPIGLALGIAMGGSACVCSKKKDK